MLPINHLIRTLSLHFPGFEFVPFGDHQIAGHVHGNVFRVRINGRDNVIQLQSDGWLATVDARCNVVLTAALNDSVAYETPDKVVV